MLQRLLSEQLASDEEAAVLSHIEECSACRDLMSRMAGSGELAGEIEQHLANHGVDETGLETVLETDLIEAEIDQIKAMLGPTDDPHMMGRLGSYEVVALIGRGSTGVVFKALDRGLNRFVAIKMLMPCFAGNGAARERFAREGRSIASVRDQHVVQVFAVSEHKGLPFIVMEYLPAGSLAQLIGKGGALQTVEVTRIGMQIATALAAAHKQGIVHRDVKPANVLLANGANRALVTDFGLARLLDEASMTHSGVISGTPQFMSPEQAQGATIDHRSDLFSLGSVLYATCTAHSPFRSETVFGVIKRVCDSEPRPIQEMNDGIDDWMCDLISKLHEKDPEHRFQSAAEVAEHLAAELAHAQSPATTPEPSREWRSAGARGSNRKDTPKTWPVAIGTVTIGVIGLLVAGLFAMQRGNDSDTVSNPTETLHVRSPNSFTIFPSGTTRLGMTYSVLKHNPALEQAFKHFNSGQYAEAIKHFEVAAEQPNLVGLAQYNIGCSFANLNQEGPAIDALRQAIEAGFSVKQQYLCDQDLDRLRESESFKELITLLDTRAEVRVLLADAQTYKVCSKYAQAEERYREILDLSPDRDDAAMNLGLMLHLQQKLDDALPWHQRTAESECYSHFGYYNIACYHALKEQTDEAFFYLQKAIEAGYIDTCYLNTDTDLDSIREDARYAALMEYAEHQRGPQIVECNTCETDQT